MPDLETAIKVKEHLDKIMEAAAHLPYSLYGAVQEHCVAILELLKKKKKGEK